MFEDKYIELKRLKKNNTIGSIIIILIVLISFTSPILIPYYFHNVLNYLEGSTMYIVIAILVAVVLIITVYIKLCSPYNRLKSELTIEVKNTILKSEMNNAFNGSYKKEDSEEFLKILEENKIGFSEIIDVNDYFSAKYNDINFQYADVRFYHHSDDSIVTTFRGPIYVFDTKNTIEGDLYISKKDKLLFSYYSEMDSFIDTRENKDIKPSNNVLDDNISIKSNAHPNIIEDTSFQEIIKEYMINNKYMFIYKGNKLYILNYNYVDAFEIKINTKEDEQKAKEHIVNNINAIKSDLDNIIRYRERLNIKEDTF